MTSETRETVQPGEKILTFDQRIAGAFSFIVIACKKKDKIDTALKVAFLTLQMADLMLTLVAARNGWIELNPVMRAQLDALYKIMLFKFAVPILVSWFVPGRLLIPAILLLCGILGWNFHQMICLMF
jgi:hypothetical protein